MRVTGKKWFLYLKLNNKGIMMEIHNESKGNGREFYGRKMNETSWIQFPMRGRKQGCKGGMEGGRKDGWKELRKGGREKG